MKIPKNVAQAVDLYYAKRQERLTASKVVAELEAEEKLLRGHLINAIPKTEATGIAGQTCRVSVVVKEKVAVVDWDAVYGFIVKDYKKNGSQAFGLLQRRVGEKLVKEMWENGKEVPGLSKEQYVDLSVGKL